MITNNETERQSKAAPSIDSSVLVGSDVACLKLVCDIRAAAGDPNGRLMQDELVTRIEKLRELAEYIAHKSKPAWRSGGRGVAIAKAKTALREPTAEGEPPR